MNTYFTGKVHIGLLHEPKPSIDQHDARVQRALLARVGKRYHAAAPLPASYWRKSLRPFARGLLALIFSSIISIIIIGVFK